MSKFNIYLSKQDKIKEKKSNKLFFYVYRITNLISNKHYYGSRTCNIKPSLDLKHKYTSSSKYVNEDIKLYDISNFKFKIIKEFKNPTDMMLYEAFLHNYFDVKSHKHFYNKSNVTPTGFTTIGSIMTKDINGIPYLIDMGTYNSGNYTSYLGELNKGKVNVIDSNNNIFKVSTSDIRIQSGELIVYSSIFNKGKTTVFDIVENKYIRIDATKISKDRHDFRHIKTKGKVVVTDGHNTYLVDINNEDYISGKLVSCNKNTFTGINQDGIIIKVNVEDPLYKNGEIHGINKGKVLVKDLEGNHFMLSKSDPRYLNGSVIVVSGKYERPVWECPHCGKIGKGLSNAKRWHFENCKNKKCNN